MTIKEKLEYFIKCKGISNSRFEKECGLSNGYLRQLRKAPSIDKIEMIIASFPELNKKWLMGESDDMLLSDERPEDTSTDGSYRLVPVIHIDSVGGIHSSNDILSPEYVERYVPITGARPDDVIIHQSGTSMAPAIPSGALLLIREVPDWREYIGYGDVFVLLLRDERRITKEIQRYKPDPQNYYWCVSYNPEVEDEELPKNLVRRVWKVIKVLIDKGW